MVAYRIIKLIFAFQSLENLRFALKGLYEQG
jgi:hypothetical protein